MFHLSELTAPIVCAPMAGGTSTVDLVVAVSSAGGLGFLAAGYKTPAAVAAQIGELRARQARPFGVNLFVPEPRRADRVAITAYRDRLAPEARRMGVDLPEPDWSADDHWAEKLNVVLSSPVPVVSFTFGLPPTDVVADLHRAGTWVVATVTAPDEALAAARVGVDALCVQGPDAGAHRGVHDATKPHDATPLAALVRQVRMASSLPIIAAGGLSSGTDIADVLRSGADAGQLGTAYLRTPESGATPTHKAALADPRFVRTVVTRAFSGRLARGLHNRFIDAHDAAAPVGYPQVDQLTKPIRAAAATAGDPHTLSLWAGTGYRDATDEPAEEVTRRLWADAATNLS